MQIHRNPLLQGQYFLDVKGTNIIVHYINKPIKTQMFLDQRSIFLSPRGQYNIFTIHKIHITTLILPPINSQMPFRSYKNMVLLLVPMQLLRKMKGKIVIILFDSTINLLTCYSKTPSVFSFFC